MINFLSDYGISNDTIYRLESNMATVFNINCNKRDCIEIITLLKSIGIKNIDEIMLYSLELFFNTREEVEKKLEKHDINELVASINDDFTNIDKLYE